MAVSKLPKRATNILLCSRRGVGSVLGGERNQQSPPYVTRLHTAPIISPRPGPRTIAMSQRRPTGSTIPPRGGLPFHAASFFFSYPHQLRLLWAVKSLRDPPANDRHMKQVKVAVGLFRYAKFVDGLFFWFWTSQLYESHCQCSSK